MNGFRISALWQAVLVLVAAYLLFTNAFPPLLPKSLLIQYMIITIVGVLLYFSADEARWTEFKAPVFRVLREPDQRLLRWGFLILIPGLVGYTVFGMVSPKVGAPVELRQVHPAPPGSLRVFNKKYDLSSLENPLRAEVLEKLDSDPEAAWARYDELVTAGREVYYRNCFYCHGDLLNGRGHYAHGFNPAPANFQDVGTIAQLQEAFLFWRITTGGPGLPKEGTPWNSAMPVWHEILSEQEVWQVITFLYDYVGQVPRMWDQEVSRRVSGMKDKVIARRQSMTGNDLYLDRCAVCHGELGAGDGPAAERLYPRPRDFTLALFKYKTSPGERLPKDDDLFATIKNGLPGTGMPGWESLLSDAQIRSLIPVIKRFDITVSWAPEDAPDEAFDDDGLYIGDTFVQMTEDEPLTGRVAFSTASAEQGKPVFEEVCGKCHGEMGRGNITSGKRLEDDWGNRLWPRDLTKPWTWRITNVPGDDDKARDQTIGNIYQRLSIGIPGTPMPAHRDIEGGQDAIATEDRWHVANYVYSLRGQTVPPADAPVVEAMQVADALPDTVDAEAWAAAPAVTLPLVPNVIKKDRLFTPLNDAVTVRALYNEEEIALLLEVNDRTDSRPGEPVSSHIHDDRLPMHSDAFAVQFPKVGAFQTSPVVVKPLYRHGDSGHPTTIWYWNAGSVEPQKPPGTQLLDATGPDERLVPRDGETADLSATGTWHQGRWRVLMKRPRVSGESGDVSFTKGAFIPISFANWDGNNGEVGSRHTLTTWYWLVLPPTPDPMKLYGTPAGATLVVFLAGFALVRSQRRRD